MQLRKRMSWSGWRRVIGRRLAGDGGPKGGLEMGMELLVGMKDF